MLETECVHLTKVLFSKGNKQKRRIEEFIFTHRIFIAWLSVISSLQSEGIDVLQGGVHSKQPTSHIKILISQQFLRSVSCNTARLQYCR